MKTDLFQSCGHCWVFQICWHIECSTFTEFSFRIWNSSTGIPSPPLALFVVMISKAHWISHSRMSGTRWVITPSWLSGLWRFFLYSSSVYSCHLFLISYTMEVRNRFKGLDLIDRVPDELWNEVRDTVQETGIKTIPMEKKCKKAKWLSGEALQIAVRRREAKSKGEKERHKQLNAEFQRIARRD